MRLRRLDLTRYGKFTDKVLDFGPRRENAPDLHIVYGLNEAGKSTALNGYLDLLFGIEHASSYNFLHSYKAMQVGGCLEWGAERHEIVRTKGTANTLKRTDGATVPDALLAQPLAGLGRASYRAMFSLDDETLEKGGRDILESRGDLGEILFSGSAGLAGLGAALNELHGAADALHRDKARGSSTEILRLKARLQELQKQRAEIDTVASTYGKLKEDERVASEAYEQAATDRAALRERLGQARRILAALPLAHERAQRLAALENHADLPRPPADWSATLPKLREDEARLAALMETLAEAEARLSGEIVALRPDEGVLSQAARLHRLEQALGADEEAAKDLPKRRDALAETERRIAALLVRLGRGEGEAPETLLLPAALTATLAELADARAALQTRVEATAEEARRAADALAERRTEAESVEEGEAADASRVEAALIALRGGKARGRAEAAQAALPKLHRAADIAAQALPAAARDAAALRALDLPDGGTIEAWRTRAGALARRRETHAERLRDAETALAKALARRTALENAAGALGDEEALRLREARDAAWTRHRAALDADTAESFAAALLADDRLADIRLARARDLAELRSTAAGLAEAQALARREAELLEGVGAEERRLAEELRAVLPDGFAPAEPGGADASLARLERFAGRRQTALDAFDALGEAQDSATAARDELAAERDRLAEALGAAGFTETHAGLAELEQSAERFIRAHAARLAQGKAAGERLTEARAALASRERERRAAEEALAEWSRGWNAALAQSWIPVNQSPAGVRSLLLELRDLAPALREQGDLRHRIEAMETNRHNFAGEVSDIAMRLGEGQGTDPGETLARLRARLAAAEQVAHTLQTKQHDLALQRERAQALGAEQRGVRARRDEMLGFFGLASLAEVGHALERHAERERLEARLAEIEPLLASHMRKPSASAAVEALAEVDLAATEREESELALREADAEQRMQDLFAEKRRCEAALVAVGGDDAVARLQVERRTVLLSLEEAASRWLRLKAGLLVASRALDAFRDTHRSTMMTRASQAFAEMTRGAYSGLAAMPEKGGETLFGLTQGGGSKVADAMSKGTRFQLYLALRMAGYEEFATLRPPVPFIADDIMETFDEPRSEAVLRLLAGMAGLGQVVYLTHHRHLCDLAQSVAPGVSIHEL